MKPEHVLRRAVRQGCVVLGVIAVVGGEAAAIGPSVDHDPPPSVTIQRHQELALPRGREVPGGVRCLRRGGRRQHPGRGTLDVLCRRRQCAVPGAKRLSLIHI
eukprot:7863601-Alexandrium_andersonii.AAC.1